MKYVWLFEDVLVAGDDTSAHLLLGETDRAVVLERRAELLVITLLTLAGIVLGLLCVVELLDELLVDVLRHDCLYEGTARASGVLHVPEVLLLSLVRRAHYLLLAVVWSAFVEVLLICYVDLLAPDVVLGSIVRACVVRVCRRAHYRHLHVIDGLPVALLGVMIALLSDHYLVLAKVR